MGLLPCYSVYMAKETTRVNITRANNARETYMCDSVRAHGFADYVWANGNPVDPAITPEAIVTVSLENGDFVCRVVITDSNRNEYGEK